MGYVMATDTLGSGALTTLMALVFVLGLAWLLLRLLKKWQGGTHKLGAQQAQVIETLVVGPKEKLVVVQIQGKKILIGVSPAGINLIDKFSDIDAEIFPKETVKNRASAQLSPDPNENIVI
jgi:flagellar protein FliO/FliZ